MLRPLANFSQADAQDIYTLLGVAKNELQKFGLVDFAERKMFIINNRTHCGCAYIYDPGIAKTLCTPSEFKRKKEGALQPNKNVSKNFKRNASKSLQQHKL